MLSVSPLSPNVFAPMEQYRPPCPVHPSCPTRSTTATVTSPGRRRVKPGHESSRSRWIGARTTHRTVPYGFLVYRTTYTVECAQREPAALCDKKADETKSCNLTNACKFPTEKNACAQNNSNFAAPKLHRNGRSLAPKLNFLKNNFPIAENLAWGQLLPAPLATKTDAWYCLALPPSHT